MLVLVAAYTANLSAIFSADSLVKQLKSIDDLSRHPEQKVVARRDYESQFVSFNNSILNKVLRRNASIEFANVSKGEQDKFFADVTKKLNSDYVWIDFDYKIHHFVRKIRSKSIKKRIYILDGYFSRSAFGFVMRKGWNHSASVNQLIKKWDSAGVIDDIIRKHNGDENRDDDDDKANTSIPLKSFTVLFVVIFLNGLIAVIIAYVSYGRRLRVKDGIVYEDSNSQNTAEITNVG